MTTGKRDGVMDGFFDFIVIIKWVGDFGSLGRNGDFGSFWVVLVEDEVVLAGLMRGDVGFGGQVFFVILMDVEVIWFEMAENSDMGGFAKIPKLKTGKFIDDDGG